LSEVLKNSSSFTTLFLGVRACASCLARIGLSNLTHMWLLDMQLNNIGSVGAQYICEALQSNPSISSVLLNVRD